MNVEQEVLVLGMSAYSFTNDDGEKVQGTTVHYVAPNEPLENGNGLKPIKARLEVEEFSRYQGQELPAYAKMKGTVLLTNMKLQVESFSDFKPLKKAV